MHPGTMPAPPRAPTAAANLVLPEFRTVHLGRLRNCRRHKTLGSLWAGGGGLRRPFHPPASAPPCFLAAIAARPRRGGNLQARPVAQIVGLYDPLLRVSAIAPLAARPPRRSPSAHSMARRDPPANPHIDYRPWASPAILTPITSLPARGPTLAVVSARNGGARPYIRALCPPARQPAESRFLDARPR